MKNNKNIISETVTADGKRHYVLKTKAPRAPQIKYSVEDTRTEKVRILEGLDAEHIHRKTFGC